jgi:hypothetical protein
MKVIVIHGVSALPVAIIATLVFAGSVDRFLLTSKFPAAAGCAGAAGR